MSVLTIYGHSDDCLCVTEDLTEEFHPDDGVRSYLAFSDGTVLTAVYDDGGIWRINRLFCGTAAYRKSEGTDDDGSDRVTLDGEISWVVFGDGYCRVKGC